MEKKRNNAIIGCVLLVFTVCMAMAQTPQPFSSDFTTTMQNGNNITGKWFFSPPKMRIDITSMGTGANPMGNMNMIVDTTTQTTYMLIPQQQMYMEIHGDNASHMSPGVQNLRQLGTTGDPCSNQNFTCKKVGTETVNGRSCDKYQGTDKTNNKNVTLWVDQKLHFPIKMQEQDGVTTEFTNIKEGAQDASLFKVPAGYRPFDPSVFSGRKK